MGSKISDNKRKSEIKKNRTIKLFNLHKKEFKDDTETIKLLQPVNMITSENIHLKLFMSEPIMDLSVIHLES